MGTGCVVIEGGLKNTNLRSLVRFRFDGNNKVHSMNDEGNATKETFSLNPLTLYGPDFKSQTMPPPPPQALSPSGATDMHMSVFCFSTLKAEI